MTRTVASWILVGLIGAVASAQQPKPRFEVASIRVAEPVRGGTLSEVVNAVTTRIRPDGISAPYETVHSLMMRSYGLKPYQIVGGPGWVQTDRYEINAKAGTDVPVAQIRLMLQALLEDRFKLVTHIEQREMRYQALVFARADRGLGPGIFRMEVSCTSATVNELRRKFPEKYVSPLGNGVTSNCSTAGVDTIADMLSSDLGTPVIDETGLEGPHYYALSAQRPRPGSNLGAPKIAQADLPALSTALEEQLGLKLESRKGPIDVLVIDSVSRPTEN